MSNTIELRDAEVDVDKIMERIRGSIEEKKKSQIYIEEPWMLQDISQPQLRLDLNRVSDALAMLKIAGRLDLEGEPISSHRLYSGHFIKSLKRITRFWIRKYTDAIFFKQNHFNLEIVNAFGQLNEQLQELKKENERLRQQIETGSPHDAPEKR